MSFRLKIALGLFSILLLTIIVAVTSWWGMDTALRRQNVIFSLSLKVNTLFHDMATEENSYRTSGKLPHAHAVETHLIELQKTINTFGQWIKSENKSVLRENRLKSDLATYHNDFSDFTRQMVEMETIKSRMIKESDRLLEHTTQLFQEKNQVSKVLFQQVSSMLKAEKDYMLQDSETSSQNVAQSSIKIELLAKQIQKSNADSALRLQAFRVAKAASISRSIFIRYIDEQANLTAMGTTLQFQREDLAERLRAYIKKELTINQVQIDRLKLLTIGISAFAVILAIFISTFLSTRIARPLEQLKQSANEILQGNLSTRVSINTNDEIGQLGDIFNQMTLQLQKSFNDIIRYRDTLEDQVTERTSELKLEIAERKEAENALIANQEQLKTIVDQSPIGIILWNSDFRVAQWNQAAEHIFGYNQAEARNMYAKRLLPKSMHKHLDKIWQKLITTKSGVRSHNENIGKDGTTILCDWFNTPIHDEDGTVVGALSLVENVTERMKAEKELLKMEKLESTGILAGGIAHDFNNILTAILGSLNMAQLDESLSKNTKKLIESAEKASIRAKTLTQQLLTFAKGGEPIRTATSLAAIIEDSASFVLRGGNVSCNFDLPEDLNHALVDRGQISQVIQNIVLNARHAMPGGGRIDIRGSNAHHKSENFDFLDPQKDYVKISIKDRGIGIPQKILDKIFDPYFSTKQEGSGLGLAITLSIINKHQGHILVNSEAQEGTEFIIYLPASEKVQQDQPEKSARNQTVPSLNILVMDDDNGVQQILQSMLELLGHKVTLTSSGEEAIAFYIEALNGESYFDLLIVDLTIPGGLGGKETVERLLQVDPNVKAIVSSGYSTDPVMASYRDYGFLAAVAKPYVVDSLQKAIQIASATTHSQNKV